MESYQEKGHWWIDGRRDEAVGGILSVDPDIGNSLQLFDMIDRNSIRNQVAHDRIFGVTTSGDAYTLLNCYRDSYRRSDPMGGEENYIVQYVIRGCHWGNSSNVAFDSVTMEFPLLDQWSSVYTTVSADTMPFGLDPGDTFGLTHTLPEPEEADLMKYSVKISEQLTHGVDRISGDSIESATKLTVDPKHPSRPFQRIRTYVDFVRYLLTIAYNKPVSPAQISGRNENLFQYNTLEVFYPLPGHSEVKNRPLDRDFYFTPEDITGGFQALIENWAGLWENHRPMIEMYLSSQYNENMYIQSEFLSLVQAIEAFHRRKYDSKYISEKTYEIVKNHLMELIRGDPKSVYGTRRMVKGSQISDETLQKIRTFSSAYGIGNDLGNKLNSALEHANELSLRQRLKHLVNEEYSTLIDGLPHSAKNVVHPIVETRNHYVHQLEDSGSVVREGGDIIELVIPLRQLIEAIILYELGLPEHHVRDKLFARYRQIVIS
ncbi:HEPN domain-containing protein [Haloferax prahovense]|uniref:ApeA N-terminal domain 1-containing protein n=1 Tax=Haloferax prahovense TaxID=381852 RepID=UPI003C782545